MIYSQHRYYIQKWVVVYIYDSQRRILQTINIMIMTHIQSSLEEYRRQILQ